MKTILLDVYNERVEIIDIEKKLEAYYEKLDCDCIDIVQRKIGGRWYEIMCDDEGLFRDPQKISAINDIGEPMLVGNLMFFNYDAENGDIQELDVIDIEHIKEYIQQMYTTNFPAGYPMLTQCAYK